MTQIASVSADTARTDFLKLLVTQLQTQNPLEPMDNAEFTSQLAQISSLEQLENLNGSFAKVLALQQVTQASSLVGKQVTYLDSESATTGSGKVDSVQLVNGEVKVKVGSALVDMADIQSVSN